MTLAEDLVARRERLFIATEERKAVDESSSGGLPLTGSLGHLRYVAQLVQCGDPPLREPCACGHQHLIEAVRPRSGPVRAPDVKDCIGVVIVDAFCGEPKPRLACAYSLTPILEGL